MKSFSVLAKSLLILTLALSAFTLPAKPPAGPPPYGNAYGYRLRDGAQVVIVYVEEDGSRIIDLSNCRPRTQYRLDVSEDLIHWSTVTTLRIGSDGTATYVDTMDLPHCFYQVIQTR
jgi:hypothetical protein